MQKICKTRENIDTGRKPKDRCSWRKFYKFKIQGYVPQKLTFFWKYNTKEPGLKIRVLK